MIIKNCPDYIDSKSIYNWIPSANLVEIPFNTSWLVKLVHGKHRRNGILGMIAVKLDLIDYFG